MIFLTRQTIPTFLLNAVLVRTTVRYGILWFISTVKNNLKNRNITTVLRINFVNGKGQSILKPFSQATH